MSQTIEAIYEDGVLRPVRPLQGIDEHARVKVTVEEPKGDDTHPLNECIGILPDEDAEEMQRIIADEFEKVDLSEWQ